MFLKDHPFFNAKSEQEKLAKEHLLLELGLLKQKIDQLGNNGSEISEAEELIKKLNNHEITGEVAKTGILKILGRKEAGVNAKPLGPNTGGH